MGQASTNSNFFLSIFHCVRERLVHKKLMEVECVSSESIGKVLGEVTGLSGSVRLSFRPSDEDMEKVFAALSGGGKVTIAGPSAGLDSRESSQELAGDLTLAGFVGVMAVKDMDGSRMVIANKPTWELGTGAKLDTKENIIVANPDPELAASSSDKKNMTSWKVSVGDLAEDDLVDEGALLESDELQVPTMSGCGDATAGAGKKRACANCTCGLKDEEDAAVRALQPKTVDEKLAKASGCGGCARGDAFRCAGCPFLGKPAFEPGQEKLILAMGDDDI